MPIEVLLLINLKSRDSQKKLTDLRLALRRHNLAESATHEVKKHQELVDACKQIKRLRPRLLVLAGGDGTISSVLHELGDYRGDIGLIPLGTTNNLARSLGIPLNDIDEAVNVVATRRGKAIDLAKINGVVYANVASIGLAAAVAKEVTDSLKQYLGRAAYAIVGARLLLTFKPFKVTVKDPSDKLITVFSTRLLILANGRYHSGKEISEDASIQSGQLVVFPLGGKSLPSFLYALIDFYLGARTHIEGVSYHVGKDIRVITEPQQLMEFDGELSGATPASASTIRSTFKVRY